MPDYPTGDGPQHVATADVNNDGKLDLVTANNGDDTYGVFLGNGNGTFTPLGAVPRSGFGAYFALGDVNGDGKLDLVTTGSASLGNGDGTFQAELALPAATTVILKVVVGDVTGDGAADVVGIGEFNLTLWTGNGDGTFDSPTYLNQSRGASDLVLADVNGDGTLDILAPQFQPGHQTGGHLGIGLYTWISQGGGSFQLKYLFVTPPNEPYQQLGIAGGDLNGDGYADAIVADDYFRARLIVNLGSADGTYVGGGTYYLPTQGGTTKLLTGDFDADGNIDVLAAGDYASTALLYLGNGDGTLQTPFEFATPQVSDVAAGNFDGDPALEVAGTIPATDTLVVFDLSGGHRVIRGTNAAEILTGTADADWIYGFGGSDILDGGAGADTLFGGADDDSFVVNDVGDVVTEADNEGWDVVATSVDFTLTSSVEVLRASDYAATTPLNLTGNERANSIYGNAGSNTLSGLAGNDYLLGYGGDDTIHGGDGTDAMDGGDGNDALYGGEGNDYLVGGAGNDLLDGGLTNDHRQDGYGADRMEGGAGDDDYIVDHVDLSHPDDGDVVVEIAGNGHDRVLTTVDYTLGAGVEVEVLALQDGAGLAFFTLTGNEFGNAIYGNAGTNVLNGAGGNDYLVGLGGSDTLNGGDGADALDGGAGDDTLDGGAGDGDYLVGGDGNDWLYGGAGDADAVYGGAGNDLLGGGSGIDLMFGGTGNDDYYVDNAGDLVSEAGGDGYDRVLSYADYALAAGEAIEVVATTDNTATAPLRLTGNELANALYGNAGGNVLNGGAGGDSLFGLDGGDILYAGTGSDAIDGGAGADLLYGGDGADYLVGGADADVFVFTEALGAGNIDTIADMAAGADKIALDDAVFAALAPGALAAGAFVAGPAAADADDRILYDAASGALFYDADGNGAGAAVHFASVTPGTVLTSADFVVF